ncbi:hypothetical protein YC2023_091909 [Brassica napus]
MKMMEDKSWTLMVALSWRLLQTLMSEPFWTQSPWPSPTHQLPLQTIYVQDGNSCHRERVTVVGLKTLFPGRRKIVGGTSNGDTKEEMIEAVKLNMLHLNLCMAQVLRTNLMVCKRKL